MKKYFLFITSILIFTSNLYAFERHLLGTKIVNRGYDEDVFWIGNDELFNAIQFYVAYNDIEILDLDIIFCNGDSQDPITAFYFRGNSFSRIIDFAGGFRCINRVVFKYRTYGYGHNAQLSLHGIRYR